MTIQDAAERLAAARRDGTRLADLPRGLRPDTLEQAYLIQTEAARLLGPIGGWKVGAEPDGSVRIAPIPAASIHHDRAAPPVPAPARLEAELAVMIGTDLPGGPYRPADMPAAVADAHVVVEVLEHRFLDRAAVADLTALADGNGNGRVIIGAPLPDWRDLQLSTLDVRLAGIAGGPGADAARLWSLLAALANHAVRHVGGLRAGQIVITGSRAGPLSFAAGRVEASIGTARVHVTVA